MYTLYGVHVSPEFLRRFGDCLRNHYHFVRTPYGVHVPPKFLRRFGDCLQNHYHFVCTPYDVHVSPKFVRRFVCIGLEKIRGRFVL